MPRQKHIHTFIKYKKRPGYFRCAAPDCNAIYDKEFLVGKRALCNICGTDFVLDAEDLRRAKPRCLACSETKEAHAFRAAQAILERTLAHTEEEPEEDFF